jgi:hypothetical protein
LCSSKDCSQIFVDRGLIELLIHLSSPSKTAPLLEIAKKWKPNQHHTIRLLIWSFWRRFLPRNSNFGVWATLGGVEMAKKWLTLPPKDSENRTLISKILFVLHSVSQSLLSSSNKLNRAQNFAHFEDSVPLLLCKKKKSFPTKLNHSFYKL